MGHNRRLQCTYSAPLPDGADRTNTAAATLQNSPSGTYDFTGSANVAFGAPANETDECVNVSDSIAGNLGTVCQSELPKTFTYTLTVGPYATCGTSTFTNVASFTSNDNGDTGSDDHVVNVNVPCGGGTLTPGYWKTHSSYGPAPYDDAWLAIGAAGADTTFFLSGKTYYQVLWTAPQGNVYYIVAHAYIAAKLNILNGASTTAAVDTAITKAEAFFATYTPAAALNLSKQERAKLIAYATTLDNDNNGLIGPGHCSEQNVTGASVNEGLGNPQGSAASALIYLPAIVSQ